MNIVLIQLIQDAIPLCQQHMEHTHTYVEVLEIKRIAFYKRLWFKKKTKKTPPTFIRMFYNSYYVTNKMTYDFHPPILFEGQMKLAT